MRTMATALLAAIVLLGCERKADKTQILVARLETMNNLKIIAALLITSGEQLPMKGDALDVYELERRGDIDRNNYDLFRKEKGGGPTDEEIERGDYTTSATTGIAEAARWATRGRSRSSGTRSPTPWGCPSSRSTTARRARWIARSLANALKE